MDKGDAPPLSGKDTYTRERMTKIANLVDEELPANWGFIVMAFPLGGEPGRMNYVSNAKREHVIRELEQFLERCKTGQNVFRHIPE